ncbi:hypothetical protein ACSSS7_005384 [Eimeria intestinalis]
MIAFAFEKAEFFRVHVLRPSFREDRPQGIKNEGGGRIPEEHLKRQRKAAGNMLPVVLKAALWALFSALLSYQRFAVTAVGVGQPHGSESAESALFPPTYMHALNEEGSKAVESSQEPLDSSPLAPGVDEAAGSSDFSGEIRSLGVSSPSLSTQSESSDDQASSETSSYGGRVEEKHSLNPSERIQEIGKHESHEARAAVDEGAVSLVAENQGSTVSSPHSDFFTWNPLKGGEPNEGETLKNEGTPQDFVGIRLLDELEGSADVASTAPVSASSTAGVQSGSGYQSRWQRDAPVSSVRKPVEDSRWTRTVDQEGGRSSTPRDTSRHGSSGGQFRQSPAPTTSSTQAPESRNAHKSRWRRGAPDYSQSPSAGRSRWEWTDRNTSTGRGRSTDNASHNRYTLIPRDRHEEGSNGRSATGTGYQGGYTSPRYPGSSSGPGEHVEQEGITGNKPECTVTVAGVEITSTYVDLGCSGAINVPYKSTPGSFSSRKLMVVNTRKDPVTVVFKTVNAVFTSQPTISNRRYPSFLTMDGPASFLQDASDDEQEEASSTYVKDMLKEMRKHLRKYPDTPLDVVVSFESPLDNPETAAQSQSFMQSKEGGERILQACEELLSVLEQRTNYTCEVLEAVDMVILGFPPTADGGAVAKLLTKLLELEGRRILFWELSKEASLQMVPVDKDLPTSPKPLSESPVFMQAKAELEQQCSAEATARSHLISGASPLATRIPRDPDLERRLWGLYAAKCVHAWLHGEMGHKDVVVAVVDSGVGSHVDLDTNVWKNLSESFDGRDNDGNGFIDDINGWNFTNDSSRIDDQNGHGTHVAGTIGGVSNNYGIVGCSPYVSLMKVQHFGKDGSGSIGNGVRGIAYALSNGAHVINNSWGGPDATRSLQLIIERAAQMRNGLGVLIVNAAGNDSSNNDYVPVYPAQFDYSHTIAVGSYSSDGSRSEFSNYGSRTVTLFAPGDRIYSTHFKSYAFLSGTSMATPHVSGVAALIFGVFMKSNSQVSAAEVKDIIKATLQPLRCARGISQWGGAPDAMSAVLMARLGGMWCQMQCTDMLFDLKPGETHVPTLFVRGYQEGTYSPDMPGCLGTNEGPKKEIAAKAGEQQQVEAETALPEDTPTAQEESEVVVDAS